MKLLFCGFFLAAFFLISSSSLCAEGGSNYLHELIKKANQEALSQQRYWKLLLHYEQTFFGWESEVDADSFFLAKDGKTNPKAELEATIQSFFKRTDPGEKDHPQCRFVARFNWLNEQLDFNQSKIQFQKCHLYQKWIELLQPESLSLIFPSYFLEQPASIFGHTLLRINAKKNHHLDLLNYTVNYAARVEDKDINPVSYIFQGVFGGFKGVFSMAPYYAMVMNYNDIESRDIWEYNLNLTESEVVRMLNHLWEFKGVHFDYYFFKENCSYHLLSLLEIARPDLKLREQFNAWTIPLDSIKTLLSGNQILKSIRFRPSRRFEMEKNIQLLNRIEKDLIQKMLDTMTFTNSKLWNQLSLNRKFLVLSTINHYCLLERSKKSMQFRDAILRQMSQLKIDTQTKTPEVPPKSPDFGHDSFLMAAGSGNTKISGPFQTLLVRPSLHDILSNDIGYMPYGNVEFLKTEIRFYSESKKYLLEQLDLLKITSFNPSNFISTRPSWELNIGVRSLNVAEDEFKFVRFVESGVGLSYEVPGGAIYALAGITILDGEPVSKGDHLTPQIKLGYLFSLLEIFKIQWILEKKYNQINQLKGDIGTAFYPGQNHEIRFLYQKNDINNAQSNEEYQCQYRFYF
ncbi:MAG: DUF4105 domain-containing protein [Deltaproteobacteria bacterium]|nr:DUF4105 domain-containing protein [Deltaproteobacteria bacterium]